MEDTEVYKVYVLEKDSVKYQRISSEYLDQIPPAEDIE